MDTNPPGGGYTPPTPPGGSQTPPPPPPGSQAPTPGSQELIYPPTPPKEPVIALLLNLFLICVGYFWYGQWQKGIAALVAALILAIPTCGLGAFLVAVFTAIDGYLQAQQLQQNHTLGHWTFFNDHK
ncbi:MAG: hypothetical protein ABR517_08195 [Thermoanaerobaculia bacterium]